MFPKLFFLFIVVPIIELYLLIKLGEEIGAFSTIMIIILTAAAGAWLAKTQGFTAIKAIRNSVNQGRIPANEIIHGFLILLGGFALLSPGVLTDIIGITLLIPFTRKLYMIWIGKIIKNKIRTGKWNLRLFK